MSAFDTLTEIVRALSVGDHDAVAQGFATLDGSDETAVAEETE